VLQATICSGRHQRRPRSGCCPDGSLATTFALPDHTGSLVPGGDASDARLPGSLDDVAIYNCALSATTVNTHYNSGRP
jgi:hypothetical protein